jgi:hypothetical protein
MRNGKQRRARGCGVNYRERSEGDEEYDQLAEPAGPRHREGFVALAHNPA